MTAPSLPVGAVSVRRTPEFTESTVPAGLLHRHATKAGVWGLVQVVEGTLTYRTLEPDVVEVTLTAGQKGVIEPERPHEVTPTGPVRFFVEFFEIPAPRSGSAS